MNRNLERTIQLLGEDKVKTFKDKVILVAGIGGVGGTALECLARSGFDHFILIDFDNVDESNLNRQILYTSKDIGKLKVDVAKERLLSINPNIQVETLAEKIDTGILETLIEHVDFVVDAIDYVPGKLELYSYAIKNYCPLISALGTGNRIDPTKVYITKLNKTEGDPLAKKLRYESKKLGLDLSKINVVFSKELPLIKDRVVGSMMMVPSTAGLLMAKFVIENI